MPINYNPQLANFNKAVSQANNPYDGLSIQEKSALMKLGIDNGISNLEDIKNLYNNTVSTFDLSNSPVDNSNNDLLQKSRDIVNHYGPKIETTRGTNPIKEAAYFIPYVGDALFAQDIVKDFRNKDYDAAMLGLGLLAVPNIIEKPLKAGINSIKNHIIRKKQSKYLSAFDRYDNYLSSYDIFENNKFNEFQNNANFGDLFNRASIDVLKDKLKRYESTNAFYTQSYNYSKLMDKMIKEFKELVSPQNLLDKKKISNAFYKSVIKDTEDKLYYGLNATSEDISKSLESILNKSKTEGIERFKLREQLRQIKGIAPEYIWYLDNKIDNFISPEAHIDNFLKLQQTSVRGIHSTPEHLVDEALTTSYNTTKKHGGDHLNTEGGLYTSNNIKTAKKFATPLYGGGIGYIGKLEHDYEIPKHLTPLEKLIAFKSKSIDNDILTSIGSVVTGSNLKKIDKAIKDIHSSYFEPATIERVMLNDINSESTKTAKIIRKDQIKSNTKRQDRFQAENYEPTQGLFLPYSSGLNKNLYDKYFNILTSRYNALSMLPHKEFKDYSRKEKKLYNSLLNKYENLAQTKGKEDLQNFEKFIEKLLEYKEENIYKYLSKREIKIINEYRQLDNKMFNDFLNDAEKARFNYLRAKLNYHKPHKNKKINLDLDNEELPF